MLPCFKNLKARTLRSTCTCIFIYIRTGEGTREQCRSTCIIRTGVSYVHTSVHTSSEACIQNKNTVYYAYCTHQCQYITCISTLLHVYTCGDKHIMSPRRGTIHTCNKCAHVIHYDKYFLYYIYSWIPYQPGLGCTTIIFELRTLQNF